MNRQQYVASENLTSKIKELLLPYRIVIDDELLASYADVLWKLTEKELTRAITQANSENETQYAPSPGQVYGIAMEIRAGKHAGRVLAEMQTWETISEAERQECVAAPEWQALRARLGKA